MSDADLSPIKRALLEQRRLKARIQELELALEQTKSEPIAVIGVGCRLPGARNAEEFWSLLVNGVDAISELPPDRWNLADKYDADPEAPGKFATRFGGYLEAIDQFDAARFGISPREAEMMDPQQRVLLEVTWDALEHAGLAPDSLAGTQTGVFVGIGPNDYLQRYVERGSAAAIDAYLATGNAHSVASGRIAYLLGAHGPAISLDTACSSSLVAVQLACESIRNGNCDAAIAGGAGVLLGDHNYISLSKARMMAPDGRCKAFDSRADGFVRSEGCGIVVLKSLTRARRDGDRVLAVIRGGAINQDGRSNGITAPNGPAQQAVIRAAHANGGTVPSSVSYVEAHGTGTALGDPIEVESLAAVLGEQRDAALPLFLGSVKTNIGHTEAAAGVAGLIKTVLAVHHATIPPSLHFREPNPHVAWNDFPYLRIPTRATPWTPASGTRIAGVSAFGFSGTNVHVVVEQATDVEPAATSVERPVHVLALSGKTGEAVRKAAADLVAHKAMTTAALADVCYSVNTARARLERRLALTATTMAELRDKLHGVAGQTVDAGSDGDVARVLYLCRRVAPAQRRAAMQLFVTQPAFRTAVETCAALLAADDSTRMLELFAAGDETAFDGAGPSVREAAHFAIAYGVASMWTAWGVRADAVVSADGSDVVANRVAQVVAGLLRVEDAILMAIDGRSATDADHRAPASIPVFQSSDAAARDGYTTVVDLAVADWPALADAVVRMFEGGVAVDWRGFDRGYSRRRVDVPSSPWIRERYWFDELGAGAARETSTGAWSEIASAAARQAAVLPGDMELSTYAALWKELDAFTTSAVARAIRELGLFEKAGERYTVEGAMAAGGVLPAYRHLLSLWLRRLVNAGRLTREGDDFVAPAGALASSARSELGPRSEAFPLLRGYLRRCEARMASIVRGRYSPLDTLFPDGSFDTADFLYRHWALPRYYNGILAAAVHAMVRTAGARRLRVLEIGAGTGGTAATLVPILVAAGAEYWFTDVSEHFFARAEEAFRDASGVRCVRFDLDQAPSEQGIPAHYFDLVVAANAAHATKDVERAIDHARSLLAPAGVLMLYEATTHFDWFEMSVALIEGWQHHVDDLRSETPLLTASRWADALRQRGFARIDHFPHAQPAALGHHVIIAAASASPARQSPSPAAVAEPPGARPASRQPLDGTHENGSAGNSTRPIVDALPVERSESASDPFRAKLAGLTTTERSDVLRDLVQRQVVRVMRLRPTAPRPSPSDRLMSIGMDSLMAVELRKMITQELGGAVTLPSTLIFDYPTIGAIADLILESFALDERMPVANAEPAAERSPAIADLSEAEVEVMLLEQLKRLPK